MHTALRVCRLLSGTRLQHFVLVFELCVGELQVVAIPPRTRRAQILQANAGPAWSGEFVAAAENGKDGAMRGDETAPPF